jgi:hypothetical protein
MTIIDHKISINHKLGYGTIFIILIYTKIYSKILKCHFVPSNISLLPINDNPSYTINWFKLFDFLLVDKSSRTIDSDSIERISFYKAYNKFKSCDFAHKEALIADIRNVFNENFRTHFKRKECDYVSISIHLRCSCDVETVKGILTLPYQYFDQDYKIYDNSQNYYMQLFSGIINDIYHKHCNFKKVKLNIHSLCSSLVLDEFIGHLNPSLEVTIHRNSAYLSFIDFIQSDYFIASHSSFSYLALMLRDSNTYIRSGFRHYIPCYVNILNECQLKKNLFGDLILPFLKVKKFLIYTHYYFLSFFTYSKNFFLRRDDS